jgi:hypothetical protein
MRQGASLSRAARDNGVTVRTMWRYLGGRQHAAYFTIPLCVAHHQEITIAIQRANAEMMRYTSDRTERLRRIVMACSVLQWYACQQLQSRHKPNHTSGENK